MRRILKNEDNMRRKYNLKKLTSTLKNEYELKQDGA